MGMLLPSDVDETIQFLVVVIPLLSLLFALAELAIHPCMPPVTRNKLNGGLKTTERAIAPPNERALSGRATMLAGDLVLPKSPYDALALTMSPDLVLPKSPYTALTKSQDLVLSKSPYDALTESPDLVLPTSPYDTLTKSPYAQLMRSSSISLRGGSPVMTSVYTEEMRARDRAEEIYMKSRGERLSHV